MKKILIINGHPYNKSLCNSLADAYEKGARAAEAEIKRINLYDLKFDPILHCGYHVIQELEPDLKMTQESIRWADHIVFIFPTWWMCLPALMKGFIDRTFLPGFAFKYHQGKLFPEKLLKGKSGRLIVTMDSSVLYNWIVYRDDGHESFHKGVLHFSGIKPTKCTIFDRVKFRKPEKIQKWIEGAENMGRNLK